MLSSSPRSIGWPSIALFGVFFSAIAACSENNDARDAAIAGDFDSGGVARADADAQALDATDGADAGADAGAGAVDAGGTLRAITLRVHVPEDTPAADTVFVTGDFQNWDPGAAAFALARVAANTHQITLSLETGLEIEFKFTRGSFDNVEKGSRGEEIPNRLYTVGDDATVELTVASWRDISVGPNTLTGDITTLTVPDFLNGRRVWVYLPPGYHDVSDVYPLLVMLDGQNVFDAATSFAGEWGVDETLETLIPAGDVAPMIVVAVDNGGVSRIDEYTPWPDTGVGQGGGADEHLAAIAEVLVPYLRANYRVAAGAESVGIAGSSLGGLFALYATYLRADVFARNAALSPSIWWDGEEIVAYAEAAAKPASLVWMDMGTSESATAIEEVRRMRDAMVAQGFVLGADLMYVEDPGASHNEAAWARRIPDVLRFLFPPS